jgi:hypothetical protein
MDDAAYPALFRSADQASNRTQRFYLRLIQAEYALLLLAAVFSMNIFSGATFYLIYALVFLAATAALLTRALLKPEQSWYRGRAMAESIKTLTWRYCLRAAPFGDAASLDIARTAFRDHLHQLIEQNKSTAGAIDASGSTADPVTPQMETVRALPLEQRKAYYAEHRIQDQRTWYAGKSETNKRSARNWVIVAVVAYAIAAVLALARVRYPDWQVWPIEPVIVVAASVLGWMQVKRFTELATAYGVAAHEIGLIRPKLDAVTSEAELSDFVNEAELAFSREHTLWVARQTT